MNQSKTNIGYIIFLSVVAALGGFLFGYDTAVYFRNNSTGITTIRAKHPSGPDGT